MKKILLIIGLALSLSACNVPALQTSFTNPVGLQQLDAIESTYGTALAIAVAYGNSCKQKLINQSCWNVIRDMKPYQAKAQGAVVALRKFVKSNPTVDPITFVTIAQTAVADFKSVQDKYGVH